MFMNNVFPGVFDETAQTAYIESTETFTRMFQESERYHAIMNALASVMFNEFQKR
jgi:type I restriction enzyme R subunit